MLCMVVHTSKDILYVGVYLNLHCFAIDFVLGQMGWGHQASGGCIDTGYETLSSASPDIVPTTMYFFS